MKKLFSIIAILISISAYGQSTQSAGAPTQLNSWKGAIKGENAFYLPINITAMPWFDSCGRLWFNKATDSGIYYNDCSKRLKVFTMKDTALLRSILGSGSGGGSVDSFIYATRYYVDSSIGAISFNIDSSIYATKYWVIDTLNPVAFSGDYNDLSNNLTAGSGISINGSNQVSNTGVLSINGISGALIRTTLAMYGITDAYTQTQLQTSGQSSVHWDNITNKPSFNTGTVTSVGATATNGLSVTGSPITTSGTLALSVDTTSNTGLVNKNRANSLINAAGSGYVKYSDTASLVPTKPFVNNNYFRNGLNAFGAPANIGTSNDQPFSLYQNSNQLIKLHDDQNVDMQANLSVAGAIQTSGRLDVQGTINNESIQLDNSTKLGYVVSDDVNLGEFRYIASIPNADIPGAIKYSDTTSLIPTKAYANNSFIKFSDTTALIPTKPYSDIRYLKFSDTTSLVGTKPFVTNSITTAGNGYVKYADTAALVPTKSFLANNYLSNGGNAFDGTAMIGTTNNATLQILVNNIVRSTFTASGLSVVGSSFVSPTGFYTITNRASMSSPSVNVISFTTSTGTPATINAGAVTYSTGGFSLLVRNTTTSLYESITPQTILGVAGSSSFSGNAVLISFTVTHGLGATPSQVFIQSTSSAATAPYVTNKTSTTFDVNYMVAPALGTNNVTFDWQAK